MRRLLIRPGAIGDCIVSLPALESLKEAYTEVWTPGVTVPLMRFADRAESIASTGLDLLGLPDVEPPPSLPARLRTFDSIVSWYGAGRQEFRSCVCELDLPFHFFPALPERAAAAHAVDFYLRQVQTLRNSVSIPPIPRIPCERRDEGFAVIHPFASGPGKTWPLERFRELAERLRSKLPVHWCAGPEDELEGAVRHENLYDLACWLARARVFIGNDSGIAHLAAAAGAPVVALFGPTDPVVWAPRGERVAVLRAGPMMTDIPVSAVIESVCNLLV